MPSRLVLAALGAAERLVKRSQSAGPTGAAAEREAGYILLGALCRALPQEVVAEKRVGLLALWRPALSQEAAADLDVNKFAASVRALRAHVGCRSTQRRCSQLLHKQTVHVLRVLDARLASRTAS